MIFMCCLCLHISFGDHCVPFVSTPVDISSLKRAMVLCFLGGPMALHECWPQGRPSRPGAELAPKFVLSAEKAVSTSPEHRGSTCGILPHPLPLTRSFPGNSSLCGPLTSLFHLRTSNLFSKTWLHG